MKLTPTTVYIPIEENNNSDGSSIKRFKCLQNQYILSKEELIELLTDTYYAGRLTESKFQNKYEPRINATDFINNILNQ